MQHEWDEKKNADNLRKHGVAFETMDHFHWDYAVLTDSQYVHDEERELWIGPIGETLYAVVITERGSVTRIISLREATSTEVRNWRQEF